MDKTYNDFFLECKKTMPQKAAQKEASRLYAEYKALNSNDENVMERVERELETVSQTPAIEPDEIKKTQEAMVLFLKEMETASRDNNTLKIMCNKYFGFGNYSIHVTGVENRSRLIKVVVNGVGEINNLKMN